MQDIFGGIPSVLVSAASLALVRDILNPMWAGALVDERLGFRQFSELMEKKILGMTKIKLIHSGTALGRAVKSRSRHMMDANKQRREAYMWNAEDWFHEEEAFHDGFH